MQKTWHERIVAAHLAVTDQVSHGHRLKSNRYFVWQEEAKKYLNADNRHHESAVHGSTDLFTKIELDPWADAFAEAMDNAQGVQWELESIQYEEKTGFWHYEWTWTVI